MSAGTSTTRKAAPEYFDSRYWRPECKNWEVIDWAKWDAKNPKPPMVYEPPQITTYDKKTCDTPLYTLDWWSHRSPLCVPCCLPRCLHASCCSSKTLRGTISGDDSDDFFMSFLDPSIASPHTPDVLRGVFWTRDNIAQETLMAPQNWAWKSTAGTPEAVGPVGLGKAKYNWTGDPTCFGFFYNMVNAKILINVQVHPQGKWISLTTFQDPGEEKLSWLWIYVVQEGDEFTAPDGTKLDYFKPGSLIRISWGDQKDPYFCDNEQVSYMYTLVKVAELEEEGGDDGKKKGKLVKIQPGFDELVEKATESKAKVRPVCCGRCTCNMAPLERIEYQRLEYNNLQQWAKGPPPPAAAEIDRL